MTPSEFMVEYARCTNIHDFDVVEPMIAEDAVYWFNDGSYRGREQIRAAFERTWEWIADEVYSLEDMSWIESDQVAVCLYRFRWKGMVNGISHSGSGRGTTVLGTRGGRWLVMHEHLSAEPSAAQ